MSAPTIDAPVAELGGPSVVSPPADAAVAPNSPAVRAARRLVRHWAWWSAAPVALLTLTAYLRLDEPFVAVAMLFGAVILIRVVEAYSDYDFARREEAGKLTRREKRRGS
jgi:hypothetical protein